MNANVKKLALIAIIAIVVWLIFSPAKETPVHSFESLPKIENLNGAKIF